ncbi:MAG: transcription elongation factor GreB [Gammaproteobacteria bacterium]|nr:transcription elongation factor GreB [Gammaproteobacteria bacterium]
MSRYRAPVPPSSPYITAQGYARLEQEQRDLWQRRAEVTKALSAAAAEGDRSENAEYIYRKKELREIDRRIRYLQKRLPILKVVRQAPSDPGRVFFNARVSLEDAAGSTVTYRIVGADELDTQRGHISIDSPLAKALLKHQIDDEIRFESPQGEQVYVILDIDYPTDTDNV